MNVEPIPRNPSRAIEIFDVVTPVCDVPEAMLLPTTGPTHDGAFELEKRATTRRATDADGNIATVSNTNWKAEDLENSVCALGGLRSTPFAETPSHSATFDRFFVSAPPVDAGVELFAGVPVTFHPAGKSAGRSNSWASTSRGLEDEAAPADDAARNAVATLAAAIARARALRRRSPAPDDEPVPAISAAIPGVP